MIVYLAAEIVLIEYPSAVALARTVSEAVMMNGPVYRVEAVFGVAPSVV
jgi:hypothetical protein